MMTEAKQMAAEVLSEFDYETEYAVKAVELIIKNFSQYAEVRFWKEVLQQIKNANV